MRYAKTYNPCDDCQNGFSKNNQESNICKICEFKKSQDIINRQKAEICELEAYANQLKDQRNMWMKKADEQKKEIERLEFIIERDKREREKERESDNSFGVILDLYIESVKKRKTAKAEAIKEFADRLCKTICMLNAQELSGSGKEYDDIYFHTQHLGWVTGSTTARTEIIALIGNTAKEMVGEHDV